MMGGSIAPFVSAPAFGKRDAKVLNRYQHGTTYSVSGSYIRYTLREGLMNVLYKSVLLVILVAPGALAQSAEASPRAYDVYSAFLRSQLAGHNGIDDLRVGEHAAVLAPVTTTFNATSSPQWDLVKSQCKGLRRSTFEAFQQCKADSLSLSHSFNIETPYEVASREDISSVKSFITQYPENHCVIHFSCVGFNPDEAQAFFVVERSMCHSGVQKYVLMEKDASANWILKSEAVGWIQ